MWRDPAPRHKPRAGRAAISVLAGALLLAWPALLNGFPILFSDTHAFLVQAGQPRMVWDKPWIYGPFLRLLHADTSLWGPLAGQALLTSHLLFLLARVLGRATPGRHLLLCGVLAAGSAAPWFVSLLMPDLFAPVSVLCLFLLGHRDRLRAGERWWVALLGSIAVASHLSHLPLAAGVLAAMLVLRGGRAWPAAVPLAAAICLLVATNVAGFGRWSVSPNGAVFALARLVADGPAADTIRAECPQAGWRLCAWADRLPADSDDFLWDAKGPVWSGQDGPIGLAPEAGAILRRTMLRDPLGTARALAVNGWRQLWMLRLGDTLGPEWLEASVAGSLRAYFPPAELRRFHASRQMRDGLRGVAATLAPLHLGLLGVGALAAGVLALRRGDARLSALAAAIVIAVLVNAAVTGGLSGPHDRYQARIAWLLLLPALLIRMPRRSPAVSRCNGVP